MMAEDIPEIIDDVAEPEVEVVVEVEDSVPEKKEDPYEVLQRTYQNTIAQRDNAIRRAAVAEDQAYKIAEHHVNTERTNNKAILEQAYTAISQETKGLERSYIDAMQMGDYAASAAAQRQIVQNEHKMARLEEAYTNIENAPKPQPQRQQPQQVDEFEGAIQRLPHNVQDWARKHRDDVISRQSIALAADRLAVAKGYAVGSPEYMSVLDSEMGYSNRQHQGKRQVSAPVSRGTGGGSASKVFLNAEDREMARSLSMTDAQYGAFKLKAEKEGRMYEQKYGGRRMN